MEQYINECDEEGTTNRNCDSYKYTNVNISGYYIQDVGCTQCVHSSEICHKNCYIVERARVCDDVCKIECDNSTETICYSSYAVGMLYPFDDPNNNCSISVDIKNVNETLALSDAIMKFQFGNMYNVYQITGTNICSPTYPVKKGYWAIGLLVIGCIFIILISMVLSWNCYKYKQDKKLINKRYDYATHQYNTLSYYPQTTSSGNYYRYI